MKIKLLLLMILATVQLSAVSQKGVEFYVKKYIQKKMHSPVERVETISSYRIEGTNGWRVYFLSLNVKINGQKRIMNQTVFSKGNKITFSLKSKNGQSYTKLLKPKVPASAYDDEHLLVGNKNAPHKILVVSDPFCPFCQEIVPEIIEAVEDNPNTFGLYYYHLPLVRIHPASDVTTKAMHIFQQRGDVLNVKLLYHLIVNVREKNIDVILRSIKSKTGVQLTKEEINAPSIKNAMAVDMAMKKRLMVTGTPTVFVDGLWDPSRIAYKKFIK